ncbi:MAG: putative DNA-binding protein [Clostridia bacterium]|nr:putative DNA-binding protein [Clostridia bacterium]
MAEDIYEISMLLDFYGQLLTDNQYMCMDMYYNQDLSLSEIADEIEISRQGVHDFIKRGRAILADYEKKLGLMARFCEIKKNLKNIQEDLQLIDRSDLNSGNLYMLEQIDKNLVNVITKI